MLATRRAPRIARTIPPSTRVLAGGRRMPELGPHFYAPTVLADAAPGMQLCGEETFGPVVALFRFATEEEAIAAAHDTPYGLAAYFYAQDGRRIARVSSRLEAGIVGINEGPPANQAAPMRCTAIDATSTRLGRIASRTARSATRCSVATSAAPTARCASAARRVMSAAASSGKRVSDA